ncbi:MAG: class I SAM-dependent methyltransferase [Acidimicrobiales bacterium]
MSEGNVAFQREFYDRHFGQREAAVRDQLAHPLFRSFNDRTARLAFELGARADRTGPVRFLEVGCGEGLVADGIHRTAADLGVDLAYTGLDVSASAVELARTHVPGELLVGDANEVLDGMAPGSQDIVMGKNLLHHLDDPAAFLRAAGRVVGRDGRVVIFEPNLGCPQFLLFNTLASRREQHYFKGRRRNRRAFADAGLQIVHTRQFSWLPYELAFVIRYDWFRRLFSTGTPSTIASVSRVDDRLARTVPALACYTVWAARPR